jgi:YegS/Rv2252/BmrU family lipid kinase
LLPHVENSSKFNVQDLNIHLGAAYPTSPISTEPVELPVGMKASSATRARRMMVVFNPTAGGRRRLRLEQTLQLLRESGCEVTVRATAARGDAEAIARRFGDTPTAPDLLVVAGGDGTINEAVNGVLSNGSAALPLALVPLGTANVLAAEIGLTNAPSAVARTIAHGVPARAYVGLANGRCFTAMAGVGFDAHVVANVDLGLKRRLGKGAYILESLRQLLLFRFPRYRATIDGQSFEAASVIVAKGHYYAGRYVCAPAARLDQAEFHVCLFERGGRWNAVRYAVALALGRLQRLADFRIVRGCAVTIDGPVGDPVQGDGDIIAELPVRIELAPQPLRLIVPPGRDLSA